MVDGELLLRVSAHYGVTKKVVHRTIQITGWYLRRGAEQKLIVLVCYSVDFVE